MYSKLKYCVFILAFIVFCPVFGESDYTPIYFDYKVNDEIFIGSIEVSIETIQKGKRKILNLSQKELELDFSDTGQGEVHIKFRVLEWEKKKHHKNKLIVEVKNFQDPRLNGLKLMGRQEDLVLEEGFNNKAVKFQVNGSAKDKINFLFKVENNKGETQNARNEKTNSSIISTLYYSILLDKEEVYLEEIEENEEVEAAISVVEEPIEEAQMQEEPKKKENKKNTKNMTDAEHWKYALEQNTVKEFNKYAHRAKSIKRQQAQNKIDTLKWQQARRVNTLRSYFHYLDKDAPSGAFRNEAKSKIDDKLWEKAQKAKNKSAYETYLDDSEKYKEKYEGKGGYTAKYENQASQKMANIDVEIKRNGNNFLVTLEYAEPPILQENIEFSNPKAINNLSIQNNQLNIGLAENQKVEIALQDALGKQVEFTLDNTIQALKAELKSDESTLMFYNIAGGQAPYYIQLKKDGEQFKHAFLLGKPGGDSQYLEITKDKLSQEGLEGNYTVYFTDERKAESITFPNIEIQRSSRSPLIPILTASLGFLGIVFLLMNRKKQEQRRAKEAKEIESKLKEREKKQKSVIIKKKEDDYIKNHAIPKLNGANGNVLNINKEKYFKVELDKIWRDTAVKDLFLHKNCIRALDTFVKEQNKKTMMEEVDTPEIGGFLLGNYDYQNQKQQYQVALEKFVPITPDEQGVYKIEFGSKAWAELAAVQEENEDLEVIGWFHTHPGHGLFLSKPDMRIQNGFFREKYQLAMEIDPLTDNMDTTFFSRNQSGKMNNKDDVKENAKWLNWVEIYKWTSKR